MRLAFDLDGVLADLEGALVREARRLFASSGQTVEPAVPAPADAATSPGSDEPASDAPEQLRSLALTPRQQTRLWREVREVHNFWETLDEIESGSVGRLASLAHQHRWEVLFVTSRPDSAGDIVQVQSQRWLQLKGFPIPSVYVVRGSRGRLADALELDIVIDDRPENCLDIALESKARAILVWRGDEGTVPASARRLGIGDVRTVRACLDILEGVEAPSGAGLLDRLKRAFGFKSASEPDSVAR